MQRDNVKTTKNTRLYRNPAAAETFVCLGSHRIIKVEGGSGAIHGSVFALAQ